MISTIQTTPHEPQEKIADLFACFSEGLQQVLRNREFSDQDKKNIKNINEIINRVASTHFETASQFKELASTRNKEAIDQLQYAIKILLPLKEKEFNLVHEQLRQLQEIAEVFDMTLSQKNPEKASLHKKVSLKCTHPQFIGRKEILNEIQTKFAALPPKPLVLLVLYGPPGMGKSETAIAYANDNFEKYTVIWTIAAETEETRECSYKALAESLNLPILKEDTSEDIKKRVHRQLGQFEEFEEIRWLLIYDNLEEPISFPDRGGDILITSRSCKPFLLADTIEVTPLSESESITLLKRVTRKEESEEMHQLSERLGYYPLVLGQVANYIRLNTGVTISSYLETTSDLDERKLTPTERYKTTLRSVFDHVRGALPPLALEWLQVCAHLNADSISKDYLITWLETQKECSDSSAAQNILTVIVNRGLLRFDPTKQTFSMHRLFQEILKSDEGFKEAAKLLLDIMITPNFCHYVLNGKLTEKDRTEWNLHAHKILNRSGLNILEEESKAWIMHIWSLARVDIDKCYESIQLPKKISKKSYPKIAGFVNGIAICLDKRWKYDQSLELNIQAHAIIERTLKVDHPDIANSLNIIGWGLIALEKHEEALSIFQKAHSIRKKFFGTDHPKVADSLNTIGFCLLCQKKHEKALSLFQKALFIQKQVFGVNNLKVAETLDLIGFSLLRRREYDRNPEILHEANQTFLKAYQISKKILGESHPATQGYLRHAKILTEGYCLLY